MSLLVDWTAIDVDTNPDYYMEYLDFCSANEQIRRHKRRVYKMMDIKPGHFVLDAGCGTGTDAKELLEYVGPRGGVLGIDRSAKMIDVARQRKDPATSNLNFRQDDIFALKLKDETFDRCCVQRVMQHLCDPFLALTELKRVLKPDGKLLICEPDWPGLAMGSGQERLKAALQMIIPNYGIVGFLPELIEKAGMTIIEIAEGEVTLTDSVEIEKFLLLAEARKITETPMSDLSGRKLSGRKMLPVKISGKAFLAQKRG